jgi:hypothetical protein
VLQQGADQDCAPGRACMDLPRRDGTIACRRVLATAVFDATAAGFSAYSGVSPLTGGWSGGSFGSHYNMEMYGELA